MSHKWELIPGKLWQADLFGALEPGADCLISCSPLSEVVETLGDAMHLLVRGYSHALFPFLDTDELPDMDVLNEVASMGAGLIQAGKVVVVNCNAGQNRSGLMCGVILVMLGKTGAEAVKIIQDAHPEALSNQTFKTYLETLQEDK